MKRKNLKLSGMMLAGIIILVSFFYAVNIQPVVIGGSGWFRTYAGLNSFNSYDELADFLGRYNYDYYDLDYCEEKLSGIMIAKSRDTSNGIMGNSINIGDGKTVDYSKTNIQVEGVDEPDVVKTDGTYLYILADSKLCIIKAHPAEKATVLSIIFFKDDVYVRNFFINKDRLFVFGTSQRYPLEYEEYKTDYEYCPYWWGISTTIINIYDISDRENPDLVKDIEVDGSFFDARMIGNYIYIIATEYTGNIYCKVDDNVTINIPEITINDCTRQVPADHIYYVNNSERIDTMTNVLSIDIYGDKIDQQSFLLGSSQNMYVSNNNIFLACQEYSYYYSFWNGNYQSEQTTVIHKISINNGVISCIAKGEVPGYTLNQFSMDEHNGFFRIATQTWGWESNSATNLYILDKYMNRTSEIENIAPGETMHSARFIGDKAYLVTFKKVDPFFTVDLSDPYNAKIMGELKIPGYSDYLHPYDENHIIGIGKDTVEPQEEYSWTRDFAWYQGLKIALFDVSDFENPKEVAKILIGDRGTSTPVLHDHKAFLFDRERELLVLPVSIYLISDEIKEQNDEYTGNIHGRFTFQGAFVYKLSLEDGFELRGRITHMDEDELPDDNYRWYCDSYSSFVSRSLYIDDVLYTISDNMVKMNSLDSLSEINSVVLK
jgi:uncharacterized secreted protein with C-terminal beta-propeller domain